MPTIPNPWVRLQSEGVLELLGMCERQELSAFDAFVFLCVASQASPTDGVCRSNASLIARSLRKPLTSVAYAMRRLRAAGLLARATPGRTHRYLAHPSIVRVGSDHLAARRAKDFERVSALDREAALPTPGDGSNTL